MGERQQGHSDDSDDDDDGLRFDNMCLDDDDDNVAHGCIQDVWNI